MTNNEIIEKKYAEAVVGIKTEWFNEVNSNWYNYIMELPVDLQTTYLVVVLHNQIFNGGFHQYFINGYGQFASETIDALKRIGASKRAKNLNDAFEIVNTENDIDFVFREKLMSKEINKLFKEDDLFDPLDELDTQYYNEEKEDIEELLGNYLRKL
ncbi:DMP19 family protein [Niastella populi]|uniref:DNA mimic protein DMP19 C-terminal domain-containing protein n=1 Tax=Niastella populi TaxID=550983 RepID=A0A1V9G1W1_9BACT|nr:DUF4375 domain-containing protein [Niastella populi]OQP64629.1 hypothetical protein A4R26_16425 [Niastella populi]